MPTIIRHWSDSKLPALYTPVKKLSVPLQAQDIGTL